MNNHWPNNLANTRRALKRYSKALRVDRRQALMDAVRDDASMEKWLNAEASEKREIQLAFFEDTKEINSRDNCLLMDIPTLKVWCAKAEVAEK